MKEKILPVAHVRVFIPRKRMIKLFYERRHLSLSEIRILRSKKAEFERIITILQHSLSIAEVLLLRE